MRSLKIEYLIALSFGEGWERPSLVDEYKPAGKYEVEFSIHSDEGQNLSSGVYFYQLRIVGPEINSGKVLVQTKKMILIK